MKIAINALSAKTGGGVTYLKNLIPRLAKLDRAHKYYIIVPKRADKLGMKHLNQANIKVIETRIPNLASRLLKEQFGLPIILWKHHIDILYCPANIAPFFAPCKVVLLIQSINPYVNIKRRSYYQKTRLRIIRILSKISSAKACRVLALSDCSRNLVANELGINYTKIRRVYLGVDIQQFSDKQNHKVSGISMVIREIDRYILCVSNIAEHKNYAVLINAYARLSESLLGQYALIIAGKVTQRDYYNTLLKRVTELGIHERVKFLGEVKNSALSQVYRKASLFVLPSLVENFSFTVLEAMASGLPIITANSTALPEEIGDAGLLFDPNDPNDLRTKIEEVLTNQSLREELIKRGTERAKMFSWEKCAKETLAVFEEAYNEKRSRP